MGLVDGSGLGLIKRLRYGSTEELRLGQKEVLVLWLVARELWIGMVDGSGLGLNERLGLRWTEELRL
jgi:hypothetical protein